MPSLKQSRSFSYSMQQPNNINSKIGFRTFSNPVGCSHSGASILKLNPFNSFIPFEAAVNDWFTYKINHSPQKVMKNSMKTLRKLLPLIQKCHIFSLSITTCNCIGNFHLNVLLILDDFSIILGDISDFFCSKLYECTLCRNCSNLFHILFFGLNSRIWFLYAVIWVPFITKHITYKWICTFLSSTAKYMWWLNIIV